MSLSEEKIEHGSFGTISVSRYNGGRDRLFGQAKTADNALHLRVCRGELGISFSGSNGNMYDREIILDASMTAEQWSSLILNKDNENGVPVTINFDREGRTELPQFDEIEGIDSTLDDFKAHMKTVFEKVSSNFKQAAVVLDESESIKKAQKDVLKDLCGSSTSFIRDNKQFLIDEIDAYIMKIQSDAEKRFVKSVKENLFNIDDTKLLEESTSSVIQNRYQGVAVLRSVVDTKRPFVGDYNASNGMSLSIYRAEVVKSGDERIIRRTDELLLEIALSSSQFSNLLISFNSSTNICTVVNAYGEVKEVFEDNINEEYLAIRGLYNHYDSIEPELQNLEDELGELLSKSVSKGKRDSVKFVFEKISRTVFSSFFFYAKNVFDAGIKYSIKRQEDVQSGLLSKMHKEGLIQFRKELKQLSHKDEQKFLNDLTDAKGK